MKARIDEARKTLDLSFAYADEFEKAAQTMLDREISDEMFERLAAELFPAKKDNDPNRERQYALVGLRQRSATIDDSIRGSGWGAYNAVTEYGDHFQPYKNTANATSDQRRAIESLYGKTYDLREKAARLILDPKALMN